MSLRRFQLSCVTKSRLRVQVEKKRLDYLQDQSKIRGVHDQLIETFFELVDWFAGASWRRSRTFLAAESARPSSGHGGGAGLHVPWPWGHGHMVIPAIVPPQSLFIHFEALREETIAIHYDYIILYTIQIYIIHII